MAWDLIFWMISFLINIALLASTFYQFLCLSDLEADYINLYESTSRINPLVVPEFLLQGILSALFLLTGHWFMFLITAPVTFYHGSLYMKRRHLIDVTEVFRVIGAEKKYRLVKLGFYVVLFIFVIFRIFGAGKILAYNSEFEELDIRTSLLEF